MRFYSYRQNWLLVFSMAFFLAFILSILILPDLRGSGNSRSLDNGITLSIFVILAVLIGPIWEEIAFRGVFSNKQWIKKISCLLLILIFSYLLYSWWGIIVSLIGFFSSVITTYYIVRFKINHNVFLKFFTVFLFVLIHYQFSDFKKIATLCYFSAHLAIGFLLTWVVINFGLMKSIFLHMTYNFILISIMLLSLQFIDDKSNIVKENSVELRYLKVPLINSNSTELAIEEERIVAKNSTVRNLLKYGFRSDIALGYQSIVPFAKFDFEITFNNSESDTRKVLEMLEKEKLIVKVP